MDTDLEVIIKDTTIVLTPSNVKSYMIQTLQGKHLLSIIHGLACIGVNSITVSSGCYNNLVIPSRHRSRISTQCLDSPPGFETQQSLS